MSIVYEPTDVHQHVVTFRYEDNGNGQLPLDHPAFWASAGTVLACDCGQTFVAQDWQPGECFPRWRREGRVARWRRQRRHHPRDPRAENRQITDEWERDKLPPSAAIAPPDPS